MDWYKRSCIKWTNTFLNYVILEDTSMSKWICLIMQQKQIWIKATGSDTPNLAAKSYLARIKAEIDKINVDKSKTVPVDLSNLSNVVNNEVVKKTMYDELVAKVNNIDTSGFVLKTKYDTDKSKLENKINGADKKRPNISGLIKKRIIMLKLLKKKQNT